MNRAAKKLVIVKTQKAKSIERKVLHTPYSIRHAHEAAGGRVLEALKKSEHPNRRAKVAHCPEGVFYLFITRSGKVMPLLFEEASGRLICEL